jgi:hypothetical protein
MKSRDTFEKIIPLALGCVTTLIIIILMQRGFPFVGHDYGYFIPRIIDTNIHIRLNGLTIQWFTPSFGGGLPAFPNPQNLEYSIVQVVSFFLGPWNAVLWSTAGISLLGYYFFYRTLHEKLGLHWKASTVGAVFFLGNGFYIEHLIVGHLGYQLFPLSAIIFFVLLDTKSSLFVNAAIIALMIALMIHQAGFYLLIILSLSVMAALIIVYLLHPAVLHRTRMLLTITLGLLLALMLTGSKLYAVFSFMQHFPRFITDIYPVQTFQAWTGILAQLLGVMTLVPIIIISGQKLDFLTDTLGNVTGAYYGIWETDAAISPVLIAFLLLELARFIVNIRQKKWRKSKRSHILAYFLLAITVGIITELTLAKGLLFSIMKSLPIIGSLHVNVRFASAFIFPLVIMGAFALDRFFQQRSNMYYFHIIWVLTIAALSSYFFLPQDIHTRDFKITTEQYAQHGEIYPITQIRDIEDWEVFSNHAGSYRTYEPIFGYQLEAFVPETKPGNIFEVNNGYFNMTNPVSLVFPEINNTHPFERIRITERDKLEQFLQREQPDWKIPVIQKILNLLSLLTLVACAISFLTEFIIRFSSSRTLSHNILHSSK